MNPQPPDSGTRAFGGSRRRHTKPGLRGRFTPGAALTCPHCGLTLAAAAIEHEHALIFAACCPRCDGRLTNRATDTQQADPSIYLG